MNNTDIRQEKEGTAAQKMEGGFPKGMDKVKDLTTGKKQTDFVLARNCMVAAMDEAMLLQQENGRLEHELQEERDKCARLEEQLHGLQEKLDAWESDSFYKAVNIKTIIEYTQDTDNCDKEDVATIKLMLLGLCANKVPDKVIKKIKTLKCGGKFNIEKLGQLNPVATEVHNHYHTAEQP